MNSQLLRSGLNRVGRSAIQGALAYVTVEMATKWVGDLNLTPEQAVIATLAVKLLFTLLHRLADRAPVPTLVDGANLLEETEEYAGRHVANDGKGLT